MPDQPIEGIKLIVLNSQGINEPDDLSYTYKLEANFRPPEFMIVTFVLMHGGSEELVVRGMTLEAINNFITLNGLRHHPRLRRLTITGPDGILEQIER